MLGDSVGTSAPAKGLMGMGAAAVASSRPPESTIPSQRTTLCPLCLERYELELAKLVAKESDYSTKTEAGQTLLPQWLRGGTESSSAPLQVSIQLVTYHYTQSRQFRITCCSFTIETILWCSRWKKSCSSDGVRHVPVFIPTSIGCTSPPSCLWLQLRQRLQSC